MSKSIREQRTAFYAAARLERKAVQLGKSKKAQRKRDNQNMLALLTAN